MTICVIDFLEMKAITFGYRDNSFARMKQIKEKDVRPVGWCLQFHLGTV